MNKFIAISLLSLTIASSSFAAVVVEDRRDELVLKNGEKLRCTVVANGHRAVVIVVDDEEKIYSRSEVRYIKRGEVTFNLRAYGTKRVEGLDVISGVATEEDLDSLTSVAKKPNKKTSTRKTSNKKTNPSKKSAASRGSRKTSGKKSTNSSGGVSRKQIESAMSQSALARSMVKQNGGINNVMKMLNSNPALLKQIQAYMAK